MPSLVSLRRITNSKAVKHQCYSQYCQSVLYLLVVPWSQGCPEEAKSQKHRVSATSGVDSKSIKKKNLKLFEILAEAQKG